MPATIDASKLSTGAIKELMTIKAEQKRVEKENQEKAKANADAES